MAIFLYLLKGNVDLEQLKENLKKIVISQESFRTYFVGDKQIVLPYISIDILFYDLSGEEAQLQEKHIAEINNSILNGKSNFSRPPLFKIALFKKSKESFILTFCINHILADGQSLHIFLSQLNQSYIQKTLDKASSHISYTLEYKKHCRKNYQTSSHFWKKKLIHLKDYNANLDIQKQTTQSKDEILSIDQKKIDILSQKYHVTYFYIFMTLWAQAFAKVVKSQKINFFATYHNRSFPFKGLPHIIAPIARMVPLLIDIQFNDHFETVLNKTTNSYLEVLNHIDFNVFKYFYSSKDSYLIGFNYIDLTPLSRSTTYFPFKLDIDATELRLSEGDIKYTYIFLSIHSYSHYTKLRVYGSCPNKYKKAILLSIKDKVEHLTQKLS